MEKTKETNFEIERKVCVTDILSIPMVTNKNAFVVRSGPMITFDLGEAGNTGPHQGSEIVSRDDERKTGAIR